MSHPALAATTATSTPPGSVTAAAIITIVGSSLTALIVLFLAVGYGFVGHLLMDYVSDTGSIVGSFVGVVLASLALCAVTVWASTSLLRRKVWAWWTLLVLSPVAAVMGVLAASLVLPLLVAATATAVFILLLLPSSRAWIARPAT